MKAYAFRILIIALLMVLQACVGVQTFPVAARAGDTITLPVGTQDNLNQSNVTLHYYPEGSTTPIDLTPNVRSIFKVYPDKTSRVWLDDVDRLLRYTGHSPWQNVLAVDLPVDLPQGSGYFDVILGAGVIEANPNFIKSVTAVQIAMDVLPVAANPVPNDFGFFTNPFSAPDSGDLSRLMPLRRLVLRPAVSLVEYGNDQVAAAQYIIKLSPDAALVDALDANTAIMSIIRDEIPNDSANQVQLSWSRVADVVTVNVVSPVGGIRANLVRFEMLFLFITGLNYLDVFSLSPQLQSVTYFDITGNAVALAIQTPEVVIMD